MTITKIILFSLLLPSLVYAGSCPETKKVNDSKLAWNDFDNKTLETTKKRCPELYPDAPCVKIFRKYNFQQYSVICGKEIK